MNKIDIAALSMAVAPEVITEIRETAWEGTVAVERINGLAFAISAALDSVSHEVILRKGAAATDDAIEVPNTNKREWAAISSLMEMLIEQADACAKILEQVEIAAGKVTRADRVAKIIGLDVARPAR
ncbi:hypothetical protein WBP07_13040 [Novosphingobium sp. BL-8A]|uniref:hypothetical protein n=1 Tax=Novosphingobium sp. BL-8A TaxID=3127639 RepID=UPI003757AFFD